MIIFIVFVSTSFTFMSVVRADYRTTVNEQTVAAAGTNGANFDTPARDPRIVVALIARYSLTLVGTIFLVYAVYAGFIIMTSVGEEDKINNGKSTLRTAIIGILYRISDKIVQHTKKPVLVHVYCALIRRHIGFNMNIFIFKLRFEIKKHFLYKRSHINL